VIAAVVNRHWEWKRRIREIPLPYYVIGIVLGFFVGALEPFVFAMGAGMPTAARDFWELANLFLAEFLYVFAAVLAVVNDMRLRYREESRLKGRYLEMLKSNREARDRQLREMRKMRHDIKSHLMVIGEYLEEGKPEKARAYLEQVRGKVAGRAEDLPDLGNELANAVIAGEMQKFATGVTLCCEGHIAENVPMGEYDLCTILSNLLSNAGEACAKLRDKEKRIDLLAGEYDGHLILVVKNPVEWDVDAAKLGKETSKRNLREHGYGLRNVKEAAKRHGGEVFFDVEDGVFTARVKI